MVNLCIALSVTDLASLKTEAQNYTSCWCLDKYKSDWRGRIANKLDFARSVSLTDLTCISCPDLHLPITLEQRYKNE